MNDIIRPVLILAPIEGQLGNRLSLHARALGFCLENRWDLVNLSFANQAGLVRLFSNTFEPCGGYADVQLSRVEIESKLRHLTGMSAEDAEPTRTNFRYYYRKFISRNHDARKRLSMDASFAEKYSQKEKVFVRGYIVRVPLDWMKKHNVRIRSQMDFSGTVHRDCDSLIQTFGSTINVGLHFRRRDYKSYRGGKYFFPHDTYRSVLNRLKSEFSGSNIGVFVCTDDKDEAVACFKGIENLHISTFDSPVYDMCLLSKMDRIAGPPSTFSGWSSYAGQVPLLSVEDPDSLGNSTFSVKQMSW